MGESPRPSALVIRTHHDPAVSVYFTSRGCSLELQCPVSCWGFITIGVADGIAGHVAELHLRRLTRPQRSEIELTSPGPTVQPSNHVVGLVRILSPLISMEYLGPTVNSKDLSPGTFAGFRGFLLGTGGQGPPESLLYSRALFPLCFLPTCPTLLKLLGLRTLSSKLP